MALQDAAEECKADRTIVLAAVKRNGWSLQCAAVECKADHEIVLAAVQQNGYALYFAAKECQADREIGMAAVEAEPLAVQFASDELLLDSTFAPEAKQHWYILKVSLLSGRSTVVLGEVCDSVEDIVGRCCGRLEMDRRGTQKLVHGTEVVPATA
eukprot:5140343-Amphidinium_carterae.1